MARPFLAELKDIGVVVFVRAAGLLATLGVAVLVTREMGAAAAGAFQLGNACMVIAGTIGRLGQDQLMLRRAAEMSSRDDGPGLGNALLSAMSLTALPLIACAAILYAMAGVIAGPGLEQDTIRAFALGILPFGLLWILTEALRGWQRVNVAMFWQNALAPCLLLFTCVVLLAWHGAAGVDVLGTANAACLVLACAGAYAHCAGFVRKPSLGAGRIQSLKAAMRQGLPFWGLSVLLSFSGWLETLLVYFVAGAEEVGILTAVVRTGALLAIGVNIAMAGIVARAALLYARNDMVAFGRLFKVFSVVILISTAVVAGCLLVFRDQAISIWGLPADHGDLLAVYVAFQAFQCCLILAALFAPVMGLEHQLFAVQLVNFAIKAAGIPLGYWADGLMGVVLAIGAAMSVTSVLTLKIFLLRTARRGLSFRELVRS